MIWSHRENTSFHRKVEKVQLLLLEARRLGAALSRSDFSNPLGPHCPYVHSPFFPNWRSPSRIFALSAHSCTSTRKLTNRVSAQVALAIGNMSRSVCLGFCQCVLMFYCPWEIGLYSLCTFGSFYSPWNMWVGAVILEKLPWLLLKANIFKTASEARHLKYKPHMRFFAGKWIIQFFYANFTHIHTKVWLVGQCRLRFI